ncbi:MucB/RseB C-terminal domain-containing protein [Gallaecimonas sp. GXIMD4217]|uniref:MucB/RseB C-terminal domain-containing protein n=1 Tax=Gallaecimonas sp. GXIMD4217 TaxID=3131927 RepID=UPI00311ABE8B
MIAVALLAMALGAAEPAQPDTPPVAAQAAEAAEAQAHQWLQRLSEQLANSNYVLSLVKVQNGRVQPFRYEHGRVDDQELEHLVFLNGPPREIVRKGQVVTLLDLEHPPYSYQSDSIRGPIPEAFLQSPSQLAEHYRFVLAGRSRIAGRAAQLVRVVPKDDHRHGYLVWIDRDSGLLLRSDRLNLQGEVVEQLMVVAMEAMEEASGNMNAIAQANFPAPSSNTGNLPLQQLGEVTWLPPGFIGVVGNHHRLPHLGEAVDYLLYSDGLADIAIYINPAAPNQELRMMQQGLYNLVGINHGGIEVMVVGTVPAETLERVANQVRLNTRP